MATSGLERGSSNYSKRMRMHLLHKSLSILLNKATCLRRILKKEDMKTKKHCKCCDFSQPGHMFATIPMQDIESIVSVVILLTPIPVLDLETMLHIEIFLYFESSS